MNNENSKTAEARLYIQLDVTCPHCSADFDLFEIENGRLNEDGDLIAEACPEGNWSQSHANFEMNVDCPDCGEKINVKGIYW